MASPCSLFIIFVSKDVFLLISILKYLTFLVSILTKVTL